MAGFTHFDDQGRSVMVDVSDKAITTRTAVAVGNITMSQAAYDAVQTGQIKKGDVLEVARLAAIMGTKKTQDLIPLCHNIPIEKVAVDFTKDVAKREITVACTVSTTGKTGVEMEALTGASIALLTIYDMCKAIDKAMTIQSVYLQEKKGGKSDFTHLSKG